ncbi:MAG: glycosyltransferase family 2 protein [Parvularculaceae bacterium]|nr:glycosyltransferase family 2 protein [Parvularculaceae bacterium]
MPRLSVIIVNYNAGDRLRRCVEHLDRQTFRDFETIILDNGSTDGSLDPVRAKGPAVILDEVGANLGFAAANNRGARRASGDWLVFLNPDAYAAPDWLEQLVAAAERYPWADAFGSTQLNAADRDKIDGAGDVFHIAGIPYRGYFGWPASALPAEGECFAPCAAAAMYRKSVFDSLGGFDERFFCYGEDVDLGFRLRLSGGRAVQVKAARVLHEGSGVTGRHSDFTVYHGHRNRIWLAYKNMPSALLLIGAPFRLVTDAALFVKFAIGGGLPAYCKALIDGYVGAFSLREARKAVQRARKLTVADVAGLLVWSPLKLIRREGRIAAVGETPAASPSARE